MDGVLLVDKPAGKTSHDVVAAVRRRFARGVRVGHAGTLDPFATGLLLVLVGRATRAQRFLMGQPKAYETVARLGWTSTTGDPEGELVRTGRIPDLDRPLPAGRIRQRPPAYSAVKVGGRRAYQLARAGTAVELAEREVEVTRFELLAREDDRATFAIECSSGTYVRSLIADLGDAYCLELRRTAIGPFRVDDADPERVVALGEALAAIMPVVALAGEDARRVAHGVAVRAAADSTVLLADGDGPLAIAEPRDGGMLKPIVGFRPG
ncbi:MAG TPA: tRNA pseudouridine(55) synthase TruB [Solirubrobacter sp.]|nr:tRNA pseudouridine(55) synthase TruB [Solirubrobacter sp.]